ncbi:hypothetical protein ACSBR1_008631 [Camellia fascicularis]
MSNNSNNEVMELLEVQLSKMTQCGGLIPRTQERSNSPSKHRLVDRRNPVEHRAQMAKRRRKASSGNTDGSPASICTEQKTSA